MSEAEQNREGGTARPLTIGALVGFLIGRKRAILAFADNRWTLPLGALLVLTAALAREYDGQDLVHEPWHLLRPFGASIATSLVLFGVLWVACGIKNVELSWRYYPRFLGLYWITAPLAWVYGVPHDRFTDALTAAQLNTWTLALVSLWRILLMARVVSVIWHAALLPCLLLVLMFGAAVAFVIAGIAPAPVLDLMGGLRLPPEDEFLANLVFAVQFWTGLATPILCIGALIGLKWFKPTPPALPPRSRSKLPMILAALGAAAVLGWSAAGIFTQREQQRRREVERLFEAQRVDEALARLSQFRPQDLPPSWRPMPRPGYPKDPVSFTQIREAISDNPPADWVLRVYVEAVDAVLSQYTGYGTWHEAVVDLDQHGRSVDGSEELASVEFLLRFDTAVSLERKLIVQSILDKWRTKPTDDGASSPDPTPPPPPAPDDTKSP